MAQGDYPVKDGGGNVIESGNNGGSAAAAQNANPQLVSGQSSRGGPFSQSAANNLFAVDTSGYTQINVQLAGTFVGIVTFEMSNDSTNGTDGNWQQCTGVDNSNVGNSADFATRSAPGTFTMACAARWFRARVSTYTSGTIVATYNLEQGASPSARGVFATIANALLAGTNLIGAVVAGVSASVGTAWTNAKVAAAASINATIVKASAGKLGGYTFHNNTASAKFVKFYNKATTPAPASDSALLLFTVIVPANGIAQYQSVAGKAFSTGISYCITGAIAETDVTAVAANDVVGHIDFI